MALSHSKNYKNKSKDIEDLRRRRAEISVELRKNKRDKVLLKKRNVEEIASQDENANAGQADEQKFSLEDLPSIVTAALSTNMEEKLAALKAIRKLLSTEKNPPIDEIIAAGIMPVLVDTLKLTQMPALQFEAAWVLANIASGTSNQTRKVVEQGAVPLLIQLLYSSNESLSEQSAWALGNIIGDRVELRDYVLEHGFIEQLLRLFHSNSSSIALMRNLSWVVANICRNKRPPPSIEVSQQLLPILCHLLKHSTDNPTVIDVINAFSYITDHGIGQIQLVIDSGIVEYLVPLLNHEEFKIHSPALRAVGNITTGTDEQAQVVLELNALTYVDKLLHHGNDQIKKDALWFISNIAAGRVTQIQMLIDQIIVLEVIEYLRNGSFKLQREAAWAITNMVQNGAQGQVKYLVENHVIEPICKLLTVKDTQMVHILLMTLLNIFAQMMDDYQVIADLIEECGGLDTIEALQSHESEEIYRLAFEIINDYFESANGKAIKRPPNSSITEFDRAINFDLASPGVSDEEEFESLCQMQLFYSLSQDEGQVDWLVNNEFSVVCFGCQKNPLTLQTTKTGSQVFCSKCGFSFSVKFPLSAQQFHDFFSQMMDQHTVQCQSVPKFELNSILAPSNVRMICNNCRFSQLLFPEG